MKTMKNMSLVLLNFSYNILSRQQMKLVMGGYGELPSCKAKCSGRDDAVCNCTVVGDDCSATDDQGCYCTSNTVVFVCEP